MQWINLIYLNVVNVELLATKYISLLNCYASCNKKIANLKDEILSKIDQKSNELKLEFQNELKDQIKKEASKAIKTEIKKREELKSTVSLLQEHVKSLQKQVSILECKNEELGQHGRSCCLRIEGVPSVENESSGDVLGKVKSLITEFREIRM